MLRNCRVWLPSILLPPSPQNADALISRPRCRLLPAKDLQGSLVGKPIRRNGHGYEADPDFDVAVPSSSGTDCFCFDAIFLPE